jgi:hypothetical protein
MATFQNIEIEPSNMGFYIMEYCKCNVYAYKYAINEDGGCKKFSVCISRDENNIKGA